MGRERLPDPYSTGGGRRPAVDPFPRPVRSDSEQRPSLRALLLEMWAGRLLLGAVAVKILVALWRLTGALPGAMQVVSALATLALIVSLGWFAWRLFLQIKRRLLWRVRRKLILSYIFIGVIPSLLILVFFLFAASLVFMNVSAYLFRDGYDAIIEDARVGAVAGASEIARNPGGVLETLQRVQGLRVAKYPDISVAYLPRGGRPVVVGPWKVLPPPPLVPTWIPIDGFAGSVGVPSLRTPGEETLVVRAVAKIAGPAGGSVIVDVPIDDALVDRLHASTGVNLKSVFSLAATAAAGGASPQPSTAPSQSGGLLFENSIAQLDVYNWTKGDRHQDTLSLAYNLRALYTHLSNAQSIVVASGKPLADALMYVLVAIGVLFFIIEIVALVMGLALARSITSSVHQLFTGTERVRHGDFTNRIRVESHDQLGELAESFNQMTGSIENLLQTAAEKKRLEEELRIARQIQMSLLPRGPLAFPGISVTALCVPAREVGGDYYDFFPLGDRQLGVLIADVSGKGTSAALYMAELKGLVLSLSQIYRSPRQLLMEVNRIISENLDTRSFITMTYGVLDLVEGVLTFARAGHTPLLYLPSGEETPSAQVLTPSGIVVGLRIPGANEKFADLLEEDRLHLRQGDVFVLFTDGITEAMNRDSELFGETRLAALVSEHGHLDAAELRERILREIESFVGGADQHDDMTMILMKVEEAAVREQLAV